MRHPKVRDLLRALVDAGFSPTRQSGSHQIWHHPTSVSVSVPVNHVGRDASPRVSQAVLRAIRRSRSHVVIGEHAASREDME